MPASPIVVTTEVTTELVSRIARHFKAQVVDNLLVGFKYIAEVLWQLERDGAYEDVEDADMALANVPATITRDATGPSGVVVTYTPPTAVDEAGDSPAVQFPARKGSWPLQGSGGEGDAQQPQQQQAQHQPGIVVQAARLQEEQAGRLRHLI